MPFDDEHSAPVSESVQATATKRRGTGRSHRLARRFEHRTWQASSI